jgi:hypothetical protein
VGAGKRRASAGLNWARDTCDAPGGGFDDVLVADRRNGVWKRGARNVVDDDFGAVDEHEATAARHMIATAPWATRREVILVRTR